MAKEKNKFSFTDIGGMLKEMSKKTSIIVDDNTVPKEFLSTGIHILDALISGSILNGGIQSNRITVFAGASGVGKSFICYNIAREAQRKGWKIIYIDTEHAIELDDLPNHGISTSPEDFILIRANKVEDIKFMLASFLDQMKEQKASGKDIEKTLIFLDSAGQLASIKETDDAISGNNKADMTRAKSMGSLFRIINNDLAYLNIPLVVTNHTYQTMDLFPQEVMKGGMSLYYSASTIAMLGKAKLKTGDEDDMDIGQSGIVVTAKCVKNRLAKPKKGKFEISFVSGSNPYKGLEMFCTPENYSKIGIAKGKVEIDKSTGEEVFKPGGTRWHIRHLDKAVFVKQLHTSKVFTPEVLETLEPIINAYFKFSSYDDKFSDDESEDLFDDESVNKYADDISAEDLF